MELMIVLLMGVTMILLILKLWTMEQRIEQLSEQVDDTAGRLLLHQMMAHSPSNWGNEEWGFDDDGEDDFDGVQVAQGEEADE